MVFSHLVQVCFVWTLKWRNVNWWNDISFKWKNWQFLINVLANSKSSFYTYVDLHFPIQAIVKKQVVGHSNTMWLHGMALTVVVVTNVTFVRNTKKTLGHEDKIQWFPLKNRGKFSYNSSWIHFLETKWTLAADSYLTIVIIANSFLSASSCVRHAGDNSCLLGAYFERDLVTWSS